MNIRRNWLEKGDIQFNITCYFNPQKPRQCEISGNRSQYQVCAQCCRRFTPPGSPLWLSAPYARAVWKPTGHGQSPRSELVPKTGLSKRCAARGGLYNRTRGATSAYIRSRQFHSDTDDYSNIKSLCFNSESILNLMAWEGFKRKNILNIGCQYCKTMYIKRENENSKYTQ